MGRQRRLAGSGSGSIDGGFTAAFLQARAMAGGYTVGGGNCTH